MRQESIGGYKPPLNLSYLTLFTLARLTKPSMDPTDMTLVREGLCAYHYYPL
jgi:hypothetical protein